MTVHAFSEWLAATAVSNQIRAAARRRLAGVLAVVSLGVWIGVVICGRWIAYVL